MRIRSNTISAIPDSKSRARNLTEKYRLEREALKEDLHPTGICILTNRFRTLSEVVDSNGKMMSGSGRSSTSTATLATSFSSSNEQVVENTPVSPKSQPQRRPRAMSCELNAIAAYASSRTPSPTGGVAHKSQERSSKEELCVEVIQSNAFAKPASEAQSSSYMASSLHQLCASSFPSLELVRLTLSMSPHALRQRDARGNLPLHVSVNRDDPVTMVVRELLSVYPQGARVRDSGGTLPLFLACRRPKVTGGVIKALLQVYPEAARLKVSGTMALHHLVHTGSASAECIRLLLEVCPQAAAVKNTANGNLPLHYLCAGSRPNLESVRILMAAYPSGITELNDLGETPICRALKLSINDSKVRKGARHFAAHYDENPEDPDRTFKELLAPTYIADRRERVRLLLLSSCKSALSSDQTKLLRELNWEARRPALLICSSILKTTHAETDGCSFSTFERTMCGSEDVWRFILKFL